jgi:hypothetical protein
VFIALIETILLALMLIGTPGCQNKVFWLLLTPPVPAGGGAIDLRAPVKDWTPMYHVFASRSDCEQMRQAAIAAGYNKQDIQTLQKMFSKSDQAQLGLTLIMVSHAICVSSDDARLTQ